MAPDMVPLSELLMETFTSKWPERAINLHFNLSLAFRDHAIFSFFFVLKTSE